MSFLKRQNVMLAHPATEKRILGFPLLQVDDGKYQRQFFHQPKLNGERCRVEWVADNPYFISSYGNEFRFLNHLNDQVKRLADRLGKQLRHDGEVYVHGWSRERIDSALRRKVNVSEDSVNLEYHMFDIQDYEKMQYARLHELGLVDQVIHAEGLTHLKVVEYGVCSEDGPCTLR